MECCGNCFYRKIILYGPKWDTVKLSCRKGYTMNSMIEPVEKDCWRLWSKKALIEDWENQKCVKFMPENNDEKCHKCGEFIIQELMTKHLIEVHRYVPFTIGED